MRKRETAESSATFGTYYRDRGEREARHLFSVLSYALRPQNDRRGTPGLVASPTIFRFAVHPGHRSHCVHGRAWDQGHVAGIGCLYHKLHYAAPVKPNKIECQSTRPRRILIARIRRRARLRPRSRRHPNEGRFRVRLRNIRSYLSRSGFITRPVARRLVL